MGIDSLLNVSLLFFLSDCCLDSVFTSWGPGEGEDASDLMSPGPSEFVIGLGNSCFLHLLLI